MTYPGRVFIYYGATPTALAIQAPGPPWGMADWKCPPYDVQTASAGKFNFGAWSCLYQQMLPLSVGFGTGEMKAGGDLAMTWTIVRDCSKIACGAPQDTVSFVGTKD